ncbi:nucleotide-binding universal stress UspA family protein [Thermonema lapsum]|uniref:Nucleotide-binding universal stress UspA family protein n=1 Tax=Thermonema lapsum TaxID=28195 RepID=A0A846MNF7_9BACT|nr:universal stress protein [Thermonema lapsum]NIK73108.1 nucleotide-binding universal stress UspA family protein [Thermonema lapsum]
MKKILVPTDFSEHAQKALDFAVFIARRSGASLSLLHAYHIPYRTSESVMASNKIYEILKEDSEKNLADLQAKIKKEHPQIEVETISHRGDVKNFITNKANDFDLIVMGTKGASDFENVVFGSTTATVLNNAPCPVLAVPVLAQISQINRLAYASNYEAHDLEVIDRLCEFALIFGAEIHVVHFVEPEFDDFEELIRYRGFEIVVKEKIAYPHLYVHKVATEDFNKGMSEFAEKQNISLLAMLTHKRSFLEKLFLPSLTKEIVMQSPIPVLAFRSNH